MTVINPKKLKTERLISEVKRCEICTATLPYKPRPVLQAGHAAKLLINGQAPGQRAHDTCTPWNDPSGDRLREWLNLDKKQFYDEQSVALIPMAFCYPGRGKSGDLPPAKPCAPTWHEKLIGTLEAEIILLVGQYAQSYYLRDKRTLTERVKNWSSYGGLYIPLPHPSPRNNIWLKRNSWFEDDVVPAVRDRVRRLID